MSEPQSFPEPKTEARQAFMRWLCHPVERRVPKGKEAFAEKHDVSVRSLDRWEKQPEVRLFVQENYPVPLTEDEKKELRMEIHNAERGPFEPKTAQRELFMDWLALHPEDRDPPTMTAFAEQYDVSRKTLTTWKVDYDEEISRRKVLNLERHDHDILRALVQTAKIVGKEGDKARDKYLQLRGISKETLHVKHEHEVINPRVQSDDDLIDIVLAGVMDRMEGAPPQMVEAMREAFMGQLEAPKRQVEDAEFELIDSARHMDTDDLVGELPGEEPSLSDSAQTLDFTGGDNE